MSDVIDITEWTCLSQAIATSKNILGYTVLISHKPYK
jgi:hypothetical protein